MCEWIEYDYEDEGTKPEQGRPLWYYFDYTGVAHGEYYGEWCFAGQRGFLCGDVTHWQYGEETDERPAPPVTDDD